MAVQENKKSVDDVISERFMAQLREGVIPWEKPWLSISGERTGGWAHQTGNSYSLLNQMMLPEEGEYITYRQIQSEGGRLKKGAKGYPICFWKNYQTTVRNPETNVEEEKDIPCLRYYTVFRVEDCEGITQNFAPDTSKLDGLKEPQRCKLAEEVIKTYLAESGVKFQSKAQDRAFYRPFTDTVTVPLKKQFKSKAEYYSTVFHELVHSTGHHDRLNRLGTDTQAARGERYSLEELVAEIGAAAILYKLGIETKKSIRNSNAYLQSWLTALQNDNKMIVKAAGRAQKAVRYIIEGPEGLTPHGDWKPMKPVVIDDDVKAMLPV